MTAAPLVSIIVPSFNQGRFLAQTLDSILAQDHRPLEVLVMDGGSTDETVEVLRRYAAQHPELQWISEPDRGPADAVNKGLARARGLFAGVQSSDDLYRPGAIREAVAELRADPALTLICGDIELIDIHGRVEGHVAAGRPLTPANLLARSCVVHQSSAFFRVDAARAAGGWDGRYFCCDAEFWMRLLLAGGRGRRVARTWSAWRRHDVQRDKEARKVWDAWRRMIDDSPLLRGAPLHLRLAAEAGHSLLTLKYNPTGSKWFRLFHVWRAVLLYPPSLLGIPRKSVLVPGVGALRHAAGRLLTGDSRG
ncbi:glycosyltransferase family 2 protein [Fontimonas sp. SYSU GA230001]|uniref:glycosyltransferase family 2 protein n=1 Tax=Fontimonas sp. SYSU GA230001 TaxID=3142450 RepID=UPI0032B34642